MKIEQSPLAELKPHPRNYRAHPIEQIEHLRQSLLEHDVYRNVVIARDGTVLAGHGIVEAARSLKMTTIPCVRLDLDPGEPRALKLLAADNSLSQLSQDDDRAFTTLLTEIRESDEAGLLGTGYDNAMLAALLLATRTPDEIPRHDNAGEWLGMPDNGTQKKSICQVYFATAADREAFGKLVGQDVSGTYIWFPPRPIGQEKHDVRNVKIC